MPAHIPSMARSIWDLSLYGEVSKQRAGRTIGYYALLLLVTSLLLATTLTFGLRSAINKHLIPELHKLPVITIKNHEASANVPQPWVKSIDGDGAQLKMIFVIDTTGKTDGFQPDEQGFILTRTQLLMKNGQNGQSPTLDLKDVDDVVIDATLVKKWIPWVLAIWFGCVLVFSFLWYVFAKLFFALVLSLVGLLASATRQRTIGYGRVMTISMYAITPAILIDLLDSALQVNLNHFWIVYLIVGAVYVFLGVRRAPDDEQPAAPQAPPMYPSGGAVTPQSPVIF